MLVLNFSFFLSLLFISVSSYSQKEKQKVYGCLLLYKERKAHQRKVIDSLVSKLGKVLPNAEQKVSIYAISTCYSNITDAQANSIIENFTHKIAINPLSEENKRLLSLDKIGQEDFEAFSSKMNAMLPVLDEVMRDVTMMGRKDEEKWYENKTKIIIISVGVTVLIILIILLFCVATKDEIEEEEVNEDKKNN